MQLYHLRHVPWLQSQLIYHAQARLGTEGLDILAPREPYVCIGYHQDLEQEVDVAYCRTHGIPVFRREVGGGAVFLDGNQIFFQLVLRKDNPLAQGDRTTFYQRMLQPVADTYTELGVPSRYRPINDIVTVAGRKISGTGVAEIGDCLVLVGNLIADFDYETMVRVLRVPDEKYRDKVYKSMTENLTTLKRELGRCLSWDEMALPLIRHFESVLGTLEPAELPHEVCDKTRALEPAMLSDAWTSKRRRRAEGRSLKITGDVHVHQRLHKAPGGLLRATLEVKEDVLTDVSLSGDFFCYPQDAISELESVLEGTALENVEGVLADFYAVGGIETPGVTVTDWAQVLSP